MLTGPGGALHDGAVRDLRVCLGSNDGGPEFQPEPRAAVRKRAVAGTYYRDIGECHMPGDLTQAAPSGVLPASLCTAFTELRQYEQLQNAYHDGTIQRSQLAQTSRRTFRLSKRLSPSALATLYNFWVSQNGGLTPFAFYNPFEPAGAACTWWVAITTPRVAVSRVGTRWCFEIAPGHRLRISRVRTCRG